MNNIKYLTSNVSLRDCKVKELIINTDSISIEKFNVCAEKITLNVKNVVIDRKSNPENLQQLIINAEMLVNIEAFNAENLISVDISCKYYNGNDFLTDDRYPNITDVEIKEAA